MVAEQVHMESSTSAAAAAMAEPPTENKDFFGKALVHLDKAYESVKSGKQFRTGSRTW